MAVSGSKPNMSSKTCSICTHWPICAGARSCRGWTRKVEPMTEWMNNRTSDGAWSGDSFPTREDAIEDGVLQHAAAMMGKGTMLFDEDDEYGDIAREFYVGRVVEWHPSLDASDLIDCAREQAYDEGGEFGEDFLRDVAPEEEEELTELVQRVFDDWVARHHLRTFYLINDTERVCVNDQGAFAKEVDK